MITKISRASEKVRVVRRLKRSKQQESRTRPEARGKSTRARGGKAHEGRRTKRTGQGMGRNR
jgi:hypothetical protein